MILVDFSSIVHRKLHTSIAMLKPKKINDKYQTMDYIGMMKYLIFQDLFEINQEYGKKFGDIVLCIDKADTGYWRKDFYAGYKSRRKTGREESDVNFQEVFEHIDKLVNQVTLHLPWKVISVSKAEADDIMLVLAREYNSSEKILIHSPDKDMIQAQRYNDTVFQYSSLTKKWLVPENKHDHMDHWIMEHVVLGDASDDVPKVIDHTEFSDSFIEHLNKYNVPAEFHNPFDFKTSTHLDNETKRNILSTFDIYKMNKKGENTGILDVYKNIRFGASDIQKILSGKYKINLKKKELEKLKKIHKDNKEKVKEINNEIKSLEIDNISEHERFQEWLDSHPLYRTHYDRNFTLVMEEGIPNDIWNEIVVSFKEAKIDYFPEKFKEYLDEYNLNSISMELNNHFQINRELTAADFGW